MGKSKFSPADEVRASRSLTERIEAEVSGHAAPIEAASFMAERFAPELQPLAADDVGLVASPVSPLQRSAVGRVFAPQPERAPWASRTLLSMLILVALVPTIAFAVLYWRGAINVPRSAPMVGERSDAKATPAVQQASVMSTAPPETVLPKQDIELPSIALTVPSAIAAEAGKETSFAIALDSTNTLPVRSIITIRGLPEGMTFSAGRPFGETEWSMRPDEIGDLRFILPQTASGERALSVELVAADGRTIASATTRLEIAPDAKAALILRPEDTARIGEFLAHGRKMVEVGYVAGARSYFRRAAEAGSAEAALALGTTYDSAFIEAIGAQGIKPDIGEERVWYERAKALGSKEAEDHLAELDRQAMSVEPALAAESGPATAEAVEEEVAPSSDPALGASEPSTGETAGPEWVEISSPVNVHAAPAQDAQTLKVAQRGTRYQATGRKGRWVQVTDPATAEVGWVYSRYVAASAAPRQ